MSGPRSPKPCLFFCGFLWTHRERLEAFCERTVALWGPPLAHSRDFDFAESDYYRAEMGQGIRRTYLCYRNVLVDPSALVERKLQAAALEGEWAVEHRRSVNCDPGYINDHQVVVATFKDFAHRIYLGKGVYAHLEYIYRKGEPQVLPWTYPDYRREDHRALFKAWRQLEGAVSEEGPARA